MREISFHDDRSTFSRVNKSYNNKRPIENICIGSQHSLSIVHFVHSKSILLRNTVNTTAVFLLR